MGIIDLPSPAAGYLDEQFNDLIGHTKASTTGIFGILPQGILSQRVEMIEAVTHFLVVGLFDACSPADFNLRTKTDFAIPFRTLVGFSRFSEK